MKRLFIIMILGMLVFAYFGAEVLADCTIIGVGKDASVDGSVITSHTGCCANSRVHVVPAQDFEKGAMAPVYWGLQKLNPPDYTNYGEVIGHIPQVEHTYAYFHTGYPQINEHQLAIGESTLYQREELQSNPDIGKQIMTIEQADLFALQRCKTAREAIKLISSLMEEYGFLPSCGEESEGILIADPNELWMFEVVCVGPDWDPESGEIGAAWVAQRVPDDHVIVVPNHSVIKEVDLDSPDFMASENYMQLAIDHGWYDPASGQPFSWQEAYSQMTNEWALSRRWLFAHEFAPNVKIGPGFSLPDKTLTSNHMKPYDAYHQPDEPVSWYPFSYKPERKLSVMDVIKFQRSTGEGTIYDMTADLDWLVPDGKGGMKKSPLCTPFLSPYMRELLDITYHRNTAGQHHYGFVSQSRSWLPDPIGGVYWFFLENFAHAIHVPIYCGNLDIHESYRIIDEKKYDENSATWVYDFVDNLLQLRYQEAIIDLKNVRDPLLADFFAKQGEIEEKALELYKKDPVEARQFLTDYTNSRIEESLEAYRNLRYELLVKYTNRRR